MMKKRELIRNTCLAGVGFLATNTLGFEGQLPSWTNIEIRGYNLFGEKSSISPAAFGFFYASGDSTLENLHISGYGVQSLVKKIADDKGKLGAVSFEWSSESSFCNFGKRASKPREGNLGSLNIKFEYNKHLNYLDYLNFIKKEGFNVKIYHSKE